MSQELLNFCVQKGILVDKQVLNILNNLNNEETAKNLVERINYRYKQKILTKSFFQNNEEIKNYLFENYKNLNKKFIQDFFNELGVSFNEEIIKENKLIKKVNKNTLNLLKIYENNPKKLEVKDFVKNFKNRFNMIKQFLQERAKLDNLTSISRIEPNKQLSIIGLVFDKRVTKNGNIILEVEDLSGKISVLITKDREKVFEKVGEVLLDEVIGIKCSGSKEIVFANDILFPEAKIFEKKYSKKDDYVAFISDLHIGSNKFLENNLKKFIKWLNGDLGSEDQKKEALKVKWLLITGDSVDGVGVFPGQDKELAIKDVKEQYKKLAEILSEIRQDIQIIICPGQHDAVRIAEPQPLISKQYAEPLYYLKNINFVTNPSYIEIGSDVKFKILMYHGASMHGIINSIDKLRLGKGHDSPTDVVKYMLKKRHLAPSHSLVDYTPMEDEDAMLIKEIPDIVSTGDLHRSEVASYNGILCVASSCWQSITPFEEKVGNHPDPCKVPLLNLKTRDIKILDFSEGLDERGSKFE
jgi:DNA polymerase II small subunit